MEKEVEDKVADQKLVELKDRAEEREQSWEDKVQHLTIILANDCGLKKGQFAKFKVHKQTVAQLWSEKSEEAGEKQYLLLAGLYKNLGKLGDNGQTLEKALVLLKKGKGSPQIVIRWILQLTAMKSSHKKHQECHDLAVKVIKQCQIILKSEKQKTGNAQLKFFINFILELVEEETKDEIIWKHNSRNLEQDIFQKLQKQKKQPFPLPFFKGHNFHIADIMTLETCRQNWFKKDGIDIKNIATYLSIGFFTIATETYYMNNFSHKKDHIKSIKLALSCFDLNCTYVVFLLKILQDHFGQKMLQIAQQKSINGEQSELMYILPKQTKEVVLSDLVFPE